MRLWADRLCERLSRIGSASLPLDRRANLRYHALPAWKFEDFEHATGFKETMFELFKVRSQYIPRKCSSRNLPFPPNLLRKDCIYIN